MPTWSVSTAEGVVSTVGTVARTRTDASCAHCDLPVPRGLYDDNAERQFCCEGCKTAFEILHEHGLDRYYDLAERRTSAVRASGRRYEEFDHPTFRDLYIHALPGGLAEVELYLEGVHCGSCAWLVERVPLVVEGVSRAELELRRSLARVVWNPATVPLSKIARALESLGYPPHPFRGAERETIRRAEDRAMLVRIGVAGAVAANVMLASLALYSGSSANGMEPQYEKFFRWVSFAVVTPSMLWPGRVFFSGAWSALRTRTLHMDLPIALGLAAGYIRGAVNTVQDSGPVYFDGLASLIFALLAGRYLQLRGQRAAADGAELLHSLTPSRARVLSGEGMREIPAEALVPGMVLVVRPGETFAADGIVRAGRSQVNLSLLTGESRPTSLDVGDTVYAGTLNISAPLEVDAQRTGEATRVANIMRQVDESARRRAPIVETANRMAAWFVAVVLILALGTFAWWHQVDPARAVDNAIALLVVTCPCALALATPLAVSMAIGGAARAGIFIKGGDALERLSRPGRVFLDKTGTITEGRTAVVSWEGPDWVRPLVLALEADSTHPVADGFRRAWPAIQSPCATDTMHVAGGGIVGRVDGRNVVIGSPRFVLERAKVTPETTVNVDALAPTLTPVLVAVDGVVTAAAGLGDPIRPDSADAIARLRARGWDVAILSGDAPSVAAAVGRTLSLPPSDCIGGASPEDKLSVVESAHGDRAVVMVGDGINDAAAIAAASVGVGVHGGAEACLATSDVYLTTPGLSPLVHLMRGAERTMRVIHRNIAFAVVYNAIGAALAMTGHLTPLVAAILMPISSLTVVFTSWRGHAFEGVTQ